MRLWICVILVVLLLWLLIKPILGRPRSLFAVTLVALILIPSGIFEARWLIRENQGTEVVKVISEKEEGHLHCQRLSETFVDATQNRGHVMFDEPDKAVIKFTSCQELFGYIESNKDNPTLKQIQAVHILTHEAVHVSGDFSESSTECKAVSLNVKTAQLLGATEQQAIKLAERYFTEIFPKMPSNYYSKDCELVY